MTTEKEKLNNSFAFLGAIVGQQHSWLLAAIRGVIERLEKRVLTKDERDYLRSLVRMDIRKKERTLAKFTPKPGQDAVEAETVLAEFREHLSFRRGVLWRLTEG